MIKTTLRLEDGLRQRLDVYCQENNVKMNDAVRQFIADGIEHHRQVHDPANAYYDLLINEKRGIRASIESLLLLRNLIDDREILDKVKLKAEKVLSDGWIREEPDD